MNEQYNVTIIMSNYNQEEFISKAIDSVYSQIVNFSFILIITDDYSCKDRSREIIKQYSSQHDNIKTILATENRGYLTNILRAEEITKTEFFCILDADDYWTDINFLQRAYDFLNTHNDYTIYEANVDVLPMSGQHKRPFISRRIKAGSYSKEMLLNNEIVPITQTTGMFLRNCIFSNGIPEIMRNAVGTRSERSFEGDTGRFIMHLKNGLAYYDDKTVGVYRLTNNGIWSGMKNSMKYLFSARSYIDFYEYYDSEVQFFVNKAYRLLQLYLVEKRNELDALNLNNGFLDDNERAMVDDVYLFCKEHANQINRSNIGLKEKIKNIIQIIQS